MVSQNNFWLDIVTDTVGTTVLIGKLFPDQEPLPDREKELSNREWLPI